MGSRYPKINPMPPPIPPRLWAQLTPEQQELHLQLEREMEALQTDIKNFGPRSRHGRSGMWLSIAVVGWVMASSGVFGPALATKPGAAVTFVMSWVWNWVPNPWRRRAVIETAPRREWRWKRWLRALRRK